MNWRGGKMRADIKLEITYTIEDVIGLLNQKHSQEIQVVSNLDDFCLGFADSVSFSYNEDSQTFCLSSEVYTL